MQYVCSLELSALPTINSINTYPCLGRKVLFWKVCSSVIYVIEQAERQTEDVLECRKNREMTQNGLLPFA